MCDDLPPDAREGHDTARAMPEADAGSPILPDAPGLSVDEVRALLARVHDTQVPRDDPILMQVTISGAFLNRQDALQKRHEKALRELMSAQTSACVQKMHKSVTSLEATLSGVTVQGVQRAASAFAESLGGFRATLYLCAGIMAVSALVHVAIFMLQGVARG